MSGGRIWIVDGHNVIFAIPRLEALQTGDRGEEARAELVGALRRFALARQQNVRVVFDGKELPGIPGGMRESFIEVTFTRRSDEEADDRIIHQARLLSEQGHHVTVVTNDIHTLARALPPGVEHVPVRVFWRKYIDVARGGKRVEGDFSDVENEMQALAAAAGPPAGVGAPRTPAAPAHGAPATARPGTAGPAGGSAQASAASGAEAQRESVLKKKARGRARQERLLMRRRESRRG